MNSESPSVQNIVIPPPPLPPDKKSWVLKNLVKGRLNRKGFQYVYFTPLLLLLLLLPFGVLASFSDGATKLWENIFGSGLAQVVSWALSVVFGISVISAWIRRMHDFGWGWPVVLLSFIPIVNLVFLPVLFFKKGTPGPNRYGPPYNEVRFPRFYFYS